MNDQHRSRYDMLIRVRNFGVAHRQRFAETSSAPYRPRFFSAVEPSCYGILFQVCAHLRDQTRHVLLDSCESVVTRTDDAALTFVFGRCLCELSPCLHHLHQRKEELEERWHTFVRSSEPVEED